MDAFLSWWQHLPETINPVLFEIGSIQIRYYGLMYLTSFLVVYLMLGYRIKREKFSYTSDQCEDYIVWAIIGALVGGRIGYVLFYDFAYFIEHPIQVFWPFRKVDGEQIVGISGLSYHGGLIGVFVATQWFCFKEKIQFWKFVDFFIPVVPLGYTFGRIGNFLNGELYGRVTQVPWGMYFPGAGSYELRHPSQLYEALLEGIVLFTVLWSLRHRELFDGWLFWVYVMGYGVVRFLIEYVREPDRHLGLIAFNLSMGQILCLVMIIIPAVVLLVKSKTAKGERG